MGVVSISSSAARSPLGLRTNLPTKQSTFRGSNRKQIFLPSVVAFKSDRTGDDTLVGRKEKILLPIETPSVCRSPRRKTRKNQNKTKSVSTEEQSSCALEVDYNEAAAKLESIYKLSPATESDVVQDIDSVNRKVRRRRRNTVGDDDEVNTKTSKTVVRNRGEKAKRLSLDKRIALKRNNQDKPVIPSIQGKKVKRVHEDEKIDSLVRDYSSSTDLVSLDWKKMKIPPVLSSSEHTWLFKLMQPMKALLQVKDELKKNLEREPTEAEVAEVTSMDVAQVKSQVEIGRAARNKLIKHNLRLVLFVINKYFQDFATGPKFQDLCQEGVKGLITAIDRFEPNRKFRLSTYGLFWIRHAIIRSMTTSSFTRVPFGLESVRVEIQRAKLELWFELGKLPTDDEIAERVGISSERYHEVMKASKPVASLNARHKVTQEEFIKGITDNDGVGADDRGRPALLRLALDDVLDSLKPKESLVIRQRYGLDGKGDRTLGEIAGNLNISREMVRKHEVKALMKLKHPARVDYLRQYIV